jgi:ubiquitin-conjugating enzyme E2 Z
LNPPTPVTTPPPGPPLNYFHRQMGNEKEAKSYIQKIRHETLRISVIERLEEYLNLRPDGISSPTIVETEATDLIDDEEDDEDEDDNDDDDRYHRSSSPTEAPIGMWVDQCKRLFLWYYDIYLVHSFL